jgi:hypothetical protein
MIGPSKTQGAVSWSWRSAPRNVKGTPMPVRDEAAQACPFGAPAPQGGHVGLDPGLIDEDEPARIKSGLPGSPTLAPTRDAGASLFEGKQCFLNRSPSRRRNSQTALCETLTPRAASSAFRPCNVKCGV